MQFVIAAGTWIAANAATISTVVSVASTAFSLVSAATSAGAKVHAGESRAFAYEAQADQEMMQSESDKMNAKKESIAWRQEGTRSLKNMRAVIAATKAKAAAGGLNPLMGSTAALIDYSYMEGIDDYFTATNNAIDSLQNVEVIEGAARYQRDIYREAAENARTGGYMGAGASILEGGFRAFEAGAFRPAPVRAPISSAGNYSHFSTPT